MRGLLFSGSHSLAVALAVVLAAVIVVAQPGRAASQTCAAAVSEELERLEISRDDVKEVQFVRVLGSREHRRFLGHEAWVTLKSCSGYVVVNLDRSCRVKETYTRGDCRGAGTGNF